MKYILHILPLICSILVSKHEKINEAFFEGIGKLKEERIEKINQKLRANAKIVGGK